jgi:hypothetical protein
VPRGPTPASGTVRRVRLRPPGFGRDLAGALRAKAGRADLAADPEGCRSGRVQDEFFSTLTSEKEERKGAKTERRTRADAIAGLCPLCAFALICWSVPIVGAKISFFLTREGRERATFRETAESFSRDWRGGSGPSDPRIRGR